MTNQSVAESWIDLSKVEKVGKDIYFIGNDEVWITSLNGAKIGISNICTHKLAPINQGFLLPNDKIQCCWHGYVFDMKSGACARPGTPPLRMYDVKEENGATWIKRRPSL